MSDDYSLTLSTYVHSHFVSANLVFRDRTNPRDPKLDAYVHSGDYFVLLSTMLENLAAELPETSVIATSLALSKLADELLYLQKHYTIVPKKRPDSLTELG